ncbi:MAG: hypothetical protein AABY15_06675 [Nanoarchaeota archaeon]
MKAMKFELMRMIVLMETEKSLVKEFKAEGFDGDIHTLRMLAENDSVNHKAVLALKRVYKKLIENGSDKMIEKYNSVIEDKMKKPQYVIISVEERNGEREYTDKVVRKLAGDVDPWEWADENIAKTWLDDDDVEETEDGYMFNGGCYCVSISGVRHITREEFEVISKYF